MKGLEKNVSLRAWLFASAIGVVLPAGAMAQDVTIGGPSAATIDLEGGETLTVTAGGTIVTTGVPAVRVTAATPANAAIIANAGRIESTGRAIDAAADTTLSLVNQATGTIQGATGVYLGAGEITNRGSIIGTAGDGIYADGGSTVRLEAGSVTSAAGAGAVYAVNFRNGANTIYIDTTATVNGAIRGAASTGSGPDRAYLTGTGAATLGSFLNFEGFYFQSGDWTVTSGILAAAEGTTISSGATLRWGNGGSTGSISGNILNDGRLIVSRSNQVLALTAAAITGTGELIVDAPGGAGGLTLRASGTTYSGNTIVRNGTFRGGALNALSANSEVVVESAGIFDLVGFDQEIGGISGVGETRINGVTLTLGGTDASTSYTGALSGTGTMVKTGAGTLTYAGTGALGGGVTVQEGGLRVTGSLAADVTVAGDGSLGGTGAVTGGAVVDGTLAGASGGTLTLQSLELGAGATIAATLGSNGAPALFDVLGSLTLDGQLAVTQGAGFGSGLYRLFTYGGTLTDNGLAVAPLAGGATGEVQVATAGEVNLVVSGAGAGPGTQFWNGTRTTPNGTIQGGGGTWTAGGATNWTDLNGTLAETWGGGFAIFDGQPGTVTVDDSAGMVAASGLQFAANGYRVAGDAVTLTGASEVRVGDGTSGGAAMTATIASRLLGTNGLVKQDLGTLILTGANSYAGLTNVVGGVLQIGDGTATGVLPGDVNIAGTVGGNTPVLAFRRSDDVAYGGTITGAGELRQSGTGALTLSANSSTFAGTAVVQSGTLNLTGRLGGTAIAATGGRLGGTGEFRDVVVQGGGTLAPGLGLGGLTVRSAVFQAGSVFEVDARADGASDLLSATGQVTINGGTVRVLAGAGDYAIARDYQVIAAAGGVVRGGAPNGFEGVTSDLAFLTPSLRYSANGVTLNLARNDTDFTEVTATGNQRSVAAAIQSAGLGNVLYDAVLNLDAAGSRRAFDLASGEIHASVRTVMAEDIQRPRAAVVQRLGTAPEGFGLWLQGFMNRGDNRDRPNAARVTRKSQGMVGGLDTGAAFRFGLAFGYTTSDIGADARASEGSLRSKHLMAYAGGRAGGLRLSLGLGYADVDVETTRAPAFAGLSGSYGANYGGSVLHGFAELGLPVPFGGGSVEPFVGVTHVAARTDAFAEQGTGLLGLSADRASDRFTLSSLGLRAETSGTARLAVRAAAAWQHGFGAIVPESTLRLAGGSALPFRVTGAAIARDAAALDLELLWRLTGKMRFSLGYSGKLATNAQDHSGAISLGFAF